VDVEVSQSTVYPQPPVIDRRAIAAIGVVDSLFLSERSVALFIKYLIQNDILEDPLCMLRIVNPWSIHSHLLLSTGGPIATIGVVDSLFPLERLFALFIDYLIQNDIFVQRK
jgi:hypothetical protein